VSAPYIGQVVHYRSYGTPNGEYQSVCRAAIVTEVDPEDPGHIGLIAMNPTGLFFHALSDGGCHYSLGAEGGTWHWLDHRYGRVPGSDYVLD
jgi:hypothetical protein